MALAKFREDIVERYHEDIRELFGRGEVSPEKGWQPQQPAAIASDTVAAVRNGKFFEDRVAFLMSEEVTFGLDSPKQTTVYVSYRCDNGHEIVLNPNGKGFYRLPSGQPGQLYLRCGYYIKEYRVSWLREAKPEQLPDFSARLGTLSENPAKWTAATFESVRAELDNILYCPNVPEDFATGVKEFYLGLFHETIGEPNYRKRFEAAFTFLRPFVNYSDYAALICGYYLYRINEFDQLAAVPKLSTLSAVGNFFSGTLLATTGKAGNVLPRRPEHVSPEILVSERDYRIIECAVQQLSKQWAKAERALQAAQVASTAGLDPQGDERLAILSARLSRQLGHLEKARAEYGKLQFSPNPQFKKEADGFLQQRTSEAI